ncbi:hypothetical protein WG66_010626 [Moniliophthora roreri]|uniref:Uncharacterized protein n=1 Tax=Moniliophthora roreri TaxID=221103 RepID=A0A0W0FII9_MONRR|nr:hypothetical protein WG66_010626 [Moniliophthora roreri]
MSDYETPIPILPTASTEKPHEIKLDSISTQPKPAASKRPCKECGKLVGGGYARCRKCRELGKGAVGGGKRKESVAEDERQTKRSRKGSELEVAEELGVSSPAPTPATSSPPPETDNYHDMRTSSPGPQPQDTTQNQTQHKAPTIPCRTCQTPFRAYGSVVRCQACRSKAKGLGQGDAICQDCSLPFKGFGYVRCAVCRKKRREGVEPISTEMEYQTHSLLLRALRTVVSASKKAAWRSGPRGGGRVRFNGSYTIVKDPRISNVERAMIVAKELRMHGGIMFDYESPLLTSTSEKGKVVFRCLCGSPIHISKPTPTLPVAQGEEIESETECGGTIQITVSSDSSHPLGIEGQRVDVRVWHGDDT